MKSRTAITIVCCAAAWFASAQEQEHSTSEGRTFQEIEPIPIVQDALSFKSREWNAPDSYGASAAEVARIEPGMELDEVESILTGQGRRTEREDLTASGGGVQETYSWDGNGGEDSVVIVRFLDGEVTDIHARNLADELPPWLKSYDDTKTEDQPDEDSEEERPAVREGDYVSASDFRKIRLGFSQDYVERLLPGEGTLHRVFEHRDILYKEWMWPGNGRSGESRAVVVFRGNNVVDAYAVDLH